MSPTKPRTDAQRVAYLQRVLVLNPIQQSDLIHSLRRRFHGLAEAAPQPRESRQDLQELRRETARKIDAVRTRFWTVELDKLHRVLGGLPLEQFPDLRLAAERLQVVADHRQDFPALSEKKLFDPEFFADVRRVIVMAPRDAIAERERVTQRIRQSGRVWRAQKMIRLIARHLPEIYDLESDWFEIILQF